MQSKKNQEIPSNLNTSFSTNLSSSQSTIPKPNSSLEFFPFAAEECPDNVFPAPSFPHFYQTQNSSESIVKRVSLNFNDLPMDIKMRIFAFLLPQTDDDSLAPTLATSYHHKPSLSNALFQDSIMQVLDDTVRKLKKTPFARTTANIKSPLPKRSPKSLRTFRDNQPPIYKKHFKHIGQCLFVCRAWYYPAAFFIHSHPIFVNLADVYTWVTCLEENASLVAKFNELNAGKEFSIKPSRAVSKSRNKRSRQEISVYLPPGLAGFSMIQSLRFEHSCHVQTPHMSFLTHIESSFQMPGVFIDDSIFSRIAFAFDKLNVRLYSLNLTNCANISDSSAIHLITTVSETLEYLNLTNCRGIRDITVRSIARLCHNVTHLFLRGCGKIGDAGLRDIASALGKNLVSFDISGCMRINDPALDMFARLSCYADLYCSAWNPLRLCTNSALVAAEEFSEAREAYEYALSGLSELPIDDQISEDASYGRPGKLRRMSLARFSPAVMHVLLGAAHRTQSEKQLLILTALGSTAAAMRTNAQIAKNASITVAALTEPHKKLYFPTNRPYTLPISMMPTPVLNKITEAKGLIDAMTQLHEASFPYFGFRPKNYLIPPFGNLTTLAIPGIRRFTRGGLVKFIQEITKVQPNLRSLEFSIPPPPSTSTKCIFSWSSILFPSLFKLEHMIIRDCEFLDDDNILPIAKYCKNLQSLVLFNVVHMTSVSFDEIVRSLWHLRKLVVRGARGIHDSDMLTLRASRCAEKLEYLDVTDCFELSDESMNILSTLIVSPLSVKPVLGNLRHLAAENLRRLSFRGVLIVACALGRGMGSLISLHVSGGLEGVSQRVGISISTQPEENNINQHSVWLGAYSRRGLLSEEFEIRSTGSGGAIMQWAISPNAHQTRLMPNWYCRFSRDSLKRMISELSWYPLKIRGIRAPFNGNFPLPEIPGLDIKPSNEDGIYVITFVKDQN